MQENLSITEVRELHIKELRERVDKAFDRRKAIDPSVEGQTIANVKIVEPYQLETNESKKSKPLNFSNLQFIKPFDLSHSTKAATFPNLGKKEIYPPVTTPPIDLPQGKSPQELLKQYEQENQVLVDNPHDYLIVMEYATQKMGFDPEFAEKYARKTFEHENDHKNVVREQKYSFLGVAFYSDARDPSGDTVMMGPFATIVRSSNLGEFLDMLTNVDDPSSFDLKDLKALVKEIKAKVPPKEIEEAITLLTPKYQQLFREFLSETDG